MRNLKRIVTGDESWVHFWIPESKEKLKQWKKKEESAPQKCKQVPSAGKVMLTAFWDRQGIIYTEYHLKKERLHLQRIFIRL